MHNRELVGIAGFGLVPAMIVLLATCLMAGTRATRMDAVYWQNQTVNPRESLTPGERARLSEQALAHLRKSPAVKDQRLRVLGIKRLPPEKEAAQRSLAGVVVFNYSQGNATRLIMDTSNGVVLREERLRRRPQASEEEREEARQIIRSDPKHARLLEADGVIEGGFVVDAPGGQSTRDRFIQFQILTSDRRGLQRVVIINLTTGRVAESRLR